jgi:hypothetical protein
VIQLYDHVVLAVDRAFDESPMVVLSGEPGIGKSTIAADFVEWYAATAGVTTARFLNTPVNGDGSLGRLLDKLLSAVGPEGAYDADDGETEDARRVAATRRVLATSPMFWVWDGVPQTLVDEEGDAIDSVNLARGLLATPSGEWSGQSRILILSRVTDLSAYPFTIEVPPLSLVQMVQLLGTWVDVQSDLEQLVRTFVPVVQLARGNPGALKALLAGTRQLSDDVSEGVSVLTEVYRGNKVPFPSALVDEATALLDSSLLAHLESDPSSTADFCK